MLINYLNFLFIAQNNLMKWFLGIILALFSSGIENLSPTNVENQVDICQLKGAVYIEQVANFADYVVFVEEVEAFADFLVYLEDSQSFANDPGHWYITDVRGFADFSIYIEDIRGLEDFSIYYTDYQSFAGCNRQK